MEGVGLGVWRGIIQKDKKLKIKKISLQPSPSFILYISQHSQPIYPSTFQLGGFFPPPSPRLSEKAPIPQI